MGDHLPAFSPKCTRIFFLLPQCVHTFISFHGSPCIKKQMTDFNNRLELFYLVKISNFVGVNNHEPEASCTPEFYISKRIRSNNTSLVAKGALADRVQQCNVCKVQNGLQGLDRFLCVLSNFLKISFLIRALLL